MSTTYFLQLQQLDITCLKAHPDNPRTHSREQIKQISQSIQAFGFKLPILVDRDKQIIAGHGRVLACQELGITEVPTIIADDLSDAEVRALMLADNKLTENAAWDDELLSKNFQILSDLDLNFDLDITGFDYGDIEQFLILGEDSPDNQAEQIPVIESPHIVSQAGDIWQLGKHKIICANSLEGESYSKLLGKKKASLIFSDPPYNLPAKTIGKVCDSKHGNFAYSAGEMSADEFTAFLSQIFASCIKYSKTGSIHYFCMDWRHVAEMMNASKQHYSEFKNLCIWVKDMAGMGTFYRSQHELIFVFKNGKSKHQNHFKLGQHGRTRSNVWHYPSARNLKSANGDVDGKEALMIHPTIKPVVMIEEVLLDCSKRGEIVLDSFLGSGSTLIAAEKTKRICYGIELEPKYIDASILRWQQWTGMEAVCIARNGKYCNPTYQQLLDDLLDMGHVNSSSLNNTSNSTTLDSTEKSNYQNNQIKEA